MTTPDDERLRELLSEVEYPCDRAELLRQAAAHGADDGVLGHLGCLPERDYDGFGAVTEALTHV
jgi:hypothetical protein